jgi:hypothetical protein
VTIPGDLEPDDDVMAAVTAPVLSRGDPFAGAINEMPALLTAGTIFNGVYSFTQTNTQRGFI